MLIQCSVCKRVRKFGKWIEASEVLITDSSIPIKYMLCDDCRGINGGCERVIGLEKKVNNLTFGDKFVGAWILVMTIGVIWMGLVIFSRYSKLERIVLNDKSTSNNSVTSEVSRDGNRK